MVRQTWEHDPSLYAPARYRRACSYEAFVPDPLMGFEMTLDGELGGIISDAEQAVQALNSRAFPALAPLGRLLLRTESVASSKVEGMQVGCRELALGEIRAEVGAKVGTVVREVLDNIEAMELAVEEAGTARAVTVRNISLIHAELMAHAPNSQVAGCVRTEQNWIGGNNYNPQGAAYVPPPPQEVPALLEDLCRFMGEEDLPPVLQAALAHAQFELIHPFQDGNGRTGRALVHVVLHRRGLARQYVPPVSVVLAADRDRYIEGLQAFRQGRTQEWVAVFAAATARAAALAADYLNAVEALQETWRSWVRARTKPRSDASVWKVIELLPAHPVITVPLAAVGTGRSKVSIGQAMDLLEEVGVLVPVSPGRRHRAWEGLGLIDLLADLEAVRPPGRRSLPRNPHEHTP